MAVGQNFDDNNLTQMERVHALVMDCEGRALVKERQASPLQLSILSVPLEQGGDPMSAVKDELLALGYESPKWVYLGTYTTCHGQPTHFLFTQHAQLAPSPPSHNGYHWVEKRDLHYALLDGRINQLGDITNITLALYLLDRQSE
ncbi:MAG: hypothetical protein H6662_03470 [Ardenticatenaceae bacterium]|nr:hypothetical protein [Anaerolineales bacterium]MCB8920621.1 hypothetical protein [Ardenticatenaceae bacterium]MCB8990245.1 hypothetical protein [Ardenticatenaceae bacterium]MCB9002963.1 hypothetical protein [Ardenticatenaceae bacterium]